MNEHDHTSRALIIVMIIILIVIILLYFLPHGVYFTSPSTVTVQRSVPAQTGGQVQVYTSTPTSSYQQQTYTTTQNTTTSSSSQ